MKRGTMNIGIWMALRIPIKSRWHCGHVGLSCAEEWALQLTVWWICVNAVSSWTTKHAGVIRSSQSPLHYVRCPGLHCHHTMEWKRILIVGSVGVIPPLSPFNVFCSCRNINIKPERIMACGWWVIHTYWVFKWHQYEKPGNQHLRTMAFLFFSASSVMPNICHLLTSAYKTQLQGCRNHVIRLSVNTADGNVKMEIVSKRHPHIHAVGMMLCNKQEH